ncbi:hypothetical protein FHR32_008342 [Streptosporangium album]|uniref:Uncharacterized protein n=1 Tax=Streptosporangium album TaxID=47479 RepID=A0A7W7S4W4_9ACTN|nr:hypothetical protein [Streptosporangium album]
MASLSPRGRHAWGEFSVYTAERSCDGRNYPARSSAGFRSGTEDGLSDRH